ncbi:MULTISPECIES: hypothetical protein [unclassified Aureimonas]|uniref:hypothetical protein n=1 Tax=unclassified Aureimonas TaxID=2615206 RepID=UPI000B132B73|nr:MULTISPECIES: hypothetical protein [unclassified Aureimonas]
MRMQRQAVRGAAAAVLLLIHVLPSAAGPILPACESDTRPGRTPSCVSTGDRGWFQGSRWRLKDMEAPEINRRRAMCRAEQIAGIKVRDRLRVLLSRGYTVFPAAKTDPDGWPLVRIQLSDGRDVSSQLMSEDLVQAVPNNTNRWCDR